MGLNSAISRALISAAVGQALAWATLPTAASAAVDPRSFFAGPRTSASPEILAHPYVDGEALVVFARSVKPAVAAEVLRAAGAERIERRLVPGLYKAVLKSGRKTLEGFLSKLAPRSDVLYLTPNYLGSGGFVPNDPRYTIQWHWEQPSGVDVNAPAAWDLSRGSPAVVVAILDSGLRFDQPEFSGRLFTSTTDPPNGVDDDGNGLIDDYQGWDFVQGDNNPSTVLGGTPHGTRVAGIFGANAGNAFQIAGIDHFARILPIRVLGDTNLGDIDDLVNALYYVQERGDVGVVNLSLVNFAPVAFLGDALEAAAERSIVLACAGNSGIGTADGMYPGAHPSVLSIGSTTAADILASFSSTGTTVDFVAPGEGLITVSTDPPFLPQHITSVDGCSHATPLVAGIASLIKARYPFLSTAEFAQVLISSAVDLGPPGRDNRFGWGRVDARRALEHAISAFEIFGDGFETGDASRWSATVR
jgi:subtilisin family serine protease